MKLINKEYSRTIYVRINLTLSKLLNLKKGDKMVWKLFKDSSLKLTKYNPDTVYDHKYYKFYGLHEGNNKGELVVTLPAVLFTVMGWNFRDQYEWIMKHGNLVLRKDLLSYKDIE